MKRPLFTVETGALDDAPVRTGETTFECLQRHCAPRLVEYREWIEDLFQDLPIEHYEAFRGRLRSRDSAKFQAAAFEMQLYRMLNRLDLDVEIEGELPRTKNKIDFRVEKDHRACLIEATVCGFGQGFGQEKLSHKKNESDAIKKLKKGIPNPHLSIRLEASGSLEKTLSKKEMVEPFKELLERFTWEEFERIHNNAWYAHLFQKKCVTIKKVGDWTLKGTLKLPFPRCRGRIRGPYRSGVVDGYGPLLKSVKAKAKHWRGTDLGHPFIVAVNNCHSEFTWEDDYIDIKHALTGNPDAADSASFRPDLHRISGVIVVGNACMGAERMAPIKLFRNGNKEIPDFLHFLEEEQIFGNLL